MGGFYSPSGYLLANSWPTTMEGTTCGPVPQKWSLISLHRAVRRMKSKRGEEQHRGNSPPHRLSICCESGGTVGEQPSRNLMNMSNDDAGDCEDLTKSPLLSTISINQNTPLQIKKFEESLGNKGFDILQDTPLSSEAEQLEGVKLIQHILAQTRLLHLTKCPLCAPGSAPTWWTTKNGRKRLWKGEQRFIAEPETISNTTNLDNKGDHPLRSFLDEEGAEKNLDLSMYFGNKNRRYNLHEYQLHTLNEVSEFLQHVYRRRNSLGASCPTMYTISPESHELWRHCSSLGGIALLEVLFLGLRAQVGDHL